MKTRLLAIGLAIGVSGLSGCVVCGEPPAANQPGEPRAKVGLLGGTSWALLELNGSAVKIDSVKAEPFVDFSADGRITGMAGCNGVFGVFEADSENLKFDGLGTTKMFCPTGMDTEGRMLEALDRTLRYRVIGDTLMLLDSGSVQLARLIARRNTK